MAVLAPTSLSRVWLMRWCGEDFHRGLAIALAAADDIRYPARWINTFQTERSVRRRGHMGVASITIRILLMLPCQFRVMMTMLPSSSGLRPAQYDIQPAHAVFLRLGLRHSPRRYKAFLATLRRYIVADSPQSPCHSATCGFQQAAEERGPCSMDAAHQRATTRQTRSCTASHPCQAGVRPTATQVVGLLRMRKQPAVPGVAHFEADHRRPAAAAA